MYYLFQSDLKSVTCGANTLDLKDILFAGLATMQSIYLNDRPKGFPEKFDSGPQYTDINNQCGSYSAGGFVAEPTLNTSDLDWYTHAKSGTQLSNHQPTSPNSGFYNRRKCRRRLMAHHFCQLLLQQWRLLHAVLRSCLS